MMRTVSLRQKGLVAVLGVAAAISVSVGCSKSSGSSACATVSPNLSVLQAKIFTPSCAISGGVSGFNCHTAGTGAVAGATPAEGEDLSSTSKVLTLVSTTAIEPFQTSTTTTTHLMVINPGHHAESYMYDKLTNAPGIFLVQMPWNPTPGAPVTPLSSCDIDAIAAWIDAGAQNN